ncbi:TetR/AcrR family transcriptional regulator [Streptomyces sp. NPDC056663]|uniref:TetR/AcrR family transcriptional regulator n=1 Tax=Streptomyces sp. NPDC056663 TaxID=3345899 RepID=UPI00367C04E4
MRAEGLYSELLAAAVELASPRLATAVPSLRAVARACGVSATAVYRYFSSQSDLNRALLMRIDLVFIDAMTASDNPGLPPLERLRRFAHAYVDWGTRHPGLYQLRFESADQLGADYVRTGAADELLAGIDALLRACGSGPDATAEDLWCGLHGLVSLRVHKPGRVWSVGLEAQIDRFFTLWGLDR